MEAGINNTDANRAPTIRKDVVSHLQVDLNTLSARSPPTGASSISPFSQGGAAALTGCTDESIRRKLIQQQTILSGVFALVLFLLAILGVFALVE